jgi:DHA2 family multidrug resistance protein
MSAAKHPYERTVLATIFLMCALEFLQGGMLTFAAGPIIGEIGASPEEYTLVTIVYAVVAIASLSKQRWMIERMGWRLFLQVSVAIFIAGAAICATSSSFPHYLAGRIVMAIGGGPFLTNARVLVTLLPASPRRFRGILAFAGALTIGNGAAPWLASLAVSNDRWPGIFVLLGALAAIAGALGTLVLPADVTPADKRTEAHPMMMLAMMGGTFLSLYALLRASYDFYSNGWPLLLAVLLGLGAMVYFGHHQFHHERPLLVIKRLMIPRYVAGIATFTLGYVVLGANNYMLPVFMQGALGFPWEVVGRVQSAGLLVALPVFCIQAYFLKSAPAAKKFYVTGFTMLLLSGLWMAHLNGEAALWTDVWPGIALFGAFITPVMVTTALHTFMDLHGDEVAFQNGQQLKNMLSQFGVGMGAAGAALGLQWRGSEHATALVQSFNGANPAYSALSEQLSGQFSITHGAQAASVALGTLAQQLNQQALLLSALDYFTYLAAFGLLAAVVMVVQRVLK